MFTWCKKIKFQSQYFNKYSLVLSENCKNHNDKWKRFKYCTTYTHSRTSNIRVYTGIGRICSVTNITSLSLFLLALEWNWYGIDIFIRLSICLSVCLPCFLISNFSSFSVYKMNCYCLLLLLLLLQNFVFLFCICCDNIWVKDFFISFPLCPSCTLYISLSFVLSLF